MQTFNLLIIGDPLIQVCVLIFVALILYRFLAGRLRYPGLRRTLEEDGIVLEQKRVFTRMRFPMIYRMTFCTVVVTRYRFMLMHFLTRSKILQAPLGAAGAPGKEEGRFEVEELGEKKVLTFRTTIRGGGRIRMHVRNPEEWVARIRENES